MIASIRYLYNIIQSDSSITIYSFYKKFIQISIYGIFDTYILRAIFLKTLKILCAVKGLYYGGKHFFYFKQDPPFLLYIVSTYLG